MAPRPPRFETVSRQDIRDALLNSCFLGTQQTSRCQFLSFITPLAVSRFMIRDKMTGVALETAKVGLAPLQLVDLGTKRLLRLPPQGPID
jgi:hypothetical protein